MFYKVVLNTGVIILLISILISSSFSQDNSGATCQGVPKADRISVLNLELGMCFNEVNEILKSKRNKELKHDRDKRHHIKSYLVDYIGPLPPDSHNVKNDSTYVAFHNDVLEVISGMYYYNRTGQAKLAFETLESVMTTKYGQGYYDKQFQLTGQTYRYSKRWDTENLTAQLRIDNKNPNVLQVIYIDPNVSIMFGDQDRKTNLEKYGEGF